MDAADREKIEASRNELHNLLDKPQLQGIPVSCKHLALRPIQTFKVLTCFERNSTLCTNQSNSTCVQLLQLHLFHVLKHAFDLLLNQTIGPSTSWLSMMTGSGSPEFRQKSLPAISGSSIPLVLILVWKFP